MRIIKTMFIGLVKIVLIWILFIPLILELAGGGESIGNWWYNLWNGGDK